MDQTELTPPATSREPSDGAQLLTQVAAARQYAATEAEEAMHLAQLAGKPLDFVGFMAARRVSSRTAPLKGAIALDALLAARRPDDGDPPRQPPVRGGLPVLLGRSQVTHPVYGRSTVFVYVPTEDDRSGAINGAVSAPRRRAPGRAMRLFGGVIIAVAVASLLLFA